MPDICSLGVRHSRTYAMILEGLVTTRNPDGTPHVAPMGPRMGPDPGRFTLHPFPTAQTYRNLLGHPEGVLHSTDDVLLLARAAVGAADPFPPHRPARRVRGVVLTDACRCWEFRAADMDTGAERVAITAEVIYTDFLREFWGFNRAKHAVLEAAVLATRLHLVPTAEVAKQYAKLRVIVDKTGGPAEAEAMSFLERYVQRGTGG